jgi:hypothetical protein
MQCTHDTAQDIVHDAAHDAVHDAAHDAVPACRRAPRRVGPSRQRPRARPWRRAAVSAAPAARAARRAQQPTRTPRCASAGDRLDSQHRNSTTLGHWDIGTLGTLRHPRRPHSRPRHRPVAFRSLSMESSREANVSAPEALQAFLPSFLGLAGPPRTWRLSTCGRCGRYAPAAHSQPQRVLSRC